MWQIIASLFHAVLKFIVGVTIFLLYGYAEKVFHAGTFVSIALTLYLMRYVGVINPFLLLVFHLTAQIYQVKVVVFFSFLALNMYFLVTESVAVDDAIVTLRPCEKEIRQLLFKHNPSALGSVDTLLTTKYRGKEKALLQKIRDKYEVSASSPLQTQVHHDKIYPEKEEISFDRHVVTTSKTPFKANPLLASAAKETPAMMDNPLRKQVAVNAERSSSLKARRSDDHVSYASVYEDKEAKDEFERVNPLVGGDVDLDDVSLSQDSSLSFGNAFANPLRGSSGGAHKRSAYSAVGLESSSSSMFGARSLLSNSSTAASLGMQQNPLLSSSRNKLRLDLSSSSDAHETRKINERFGRL